MEQAAYIQRFENGRAKTVEASESQETSQSVQISNDGINNLLGGAVSTKIFGTVLALRDDALHSSLQPISK